MVFEEVLARAQQLPRTDQARLIAHLAVQIQQVLIAQPQATTATLSMQPQTTDAEWEQLMQLLADCAIETGVDSLAHLHDHHLYGKPEPEEEQPL